MNETVHLSASQQKALTILEDGEWHGLEDFLDAYVSEYRARISELRKKGYVIEDRWRTRKVYEKKLYRAKDYRLVKES